MRHAMYDQEEKASRGAVQGWTNSFPPPARGDDKYTASQNRIFLSENVKINL